MNTKISGIMVMPWEVNCCHHLVTINYTSFELPEMKEHCTTQLLRNFSTVGSRLGISGKLCAKLHEDFRFVVTHQPPWQWLA